MSVIPLIVGQTVATTDDAFEAAGGRQGSTLLIRHFDNSQLDANAPNLSYDLRIGAEYKDHRDGWVRQIAQDEPITLLPGGAVIVETEESLHLPQGMFGYIVPRVFWLQQGISNTLSKVDAGYNGRLLVTVFNLGKRTVNLSRQERFCSLVIHNVGSGVHLYDKGEKRLSGPPRRVTLWQRARDVIEAHPATATLILALMTLVLTLATGTLAVVELRHLWNTVNGP